MSEIIEADNKRHLSVSFGFKFFSRPTFHLESSRSKKFELCCAFFAPANFCLIYNHVEKSVWQKNRMKETNTFEFKGCAVAEWSLH